jgi:DNA processing protein
MTEELTSDLAAAGVVIASGMARGIDGAAHEGALAVGGRTLAVLGTGVDIIYPREHRKLREQIARTGLLVTELPPGAPPRAFHFPRRNRILAALAHVLIVVEAEPKSGALVTARWALELGRDVMVVPRSPWDAGSLGVNRLLRDGAHPVLDAGDVLLALERLGFGGWTASSKSPRGTKARTEGSTESRVLNVLKADGPLDIQGLLDSLGDIPMTDLLTLLGRLELGGRIHHGRQGYEIPRVQESLPLS